MNPLFFIPIVVLGIGVVFMIYMNKKHQSAKATIDLDQERLKYDQYKKELLENDFSKINRWLKDRPIDAFTSASIPQSTFDKITNFVGDGLKDVALSTIGVKLRRVDTACFWVLSGTDLHFLSTDTNGALEEHIVFDNFRVEKASLQYMGALKTTVGVYSKQAEQYLPKVYCITFDIDGNDLSLEIHDRLKYEPDATDMLNAERILVSTTKYRIVGERFLDSLVAKYPNLESV